MDGKSLISEQFSCHDHPNAFDLGLLMQWALLSAAECRVKRGIDWIQLFVWVLGMMERFTDWQRPCTGIGDSTMNRPWKLQRPLRMQITAGKISCSFKKPLEPGQKRLRLLALRSPLASCALVSP